MCASVKPHRFCASRIFALNIKTTEIRQRALGNSDEPQAKKSFRLEKGEFLDDLKLVEKNSLNIKPIAFCSCVYISAKKGNS